ncbi:MAG TPA: response regulator transcription factor [Gaiellaceae bacterium]
MTARILIAEDEVAIADALSYALRGEGFDVDAVGDGAEALSHAREQSYDLLVLDLMLPRVSGLEVCRQLREESAITILMLTAKDTEADHVLGLEVGADDYVTKPFSMAEVVARVRALLRRRELDSSGFGARLAVGDLVVDLVRHEATVDGKVVPLTAFELKLLALLASEPERVFSRRDIMRHLWESDHVGDERSADLHVSNIRHKIERDPANPERVVTVRGAGYKLQAV